MQYFVTTGAFWCTLATNWWRWIRLNIPN